MNEKSGESKTESKAWRTTLIIGLAITFLSALARFLEVFQSDPYNWESAGEAVQFLVLFGLPVLVVSLILWLARYKKMPSLAFVVTALTGGFFFLFSFAEVIGGLFVEHETDAAIGGLIEISTFSLPLLIVAWFLWAKPKIGSLLLMLLGIGMGIFMWQVGFGFPEEFGDWMVIGVFTAVPFVLGLFNFLREMNRPNGRLANQA